MGSWKSVMAIAAGIAALPSAWALLDSPQAAMAGCTQAVTAALRREQPDAQKLWVEADPKVARTAASETTVRGKGRLVLFNGEWQNLRFLCTFDTRTGASYIIGVVFGDMMPATAKFE